MAERKQGTVFRWVNNVKSTTLIKAMLAIVIALATWVGTYVVLYGDDRWFAKEKGEELEKKQIVLEQQLQHRHELHIIENEHTKEQLKEIKEIVSKL